MKKLSVLAALSLALAAPIASGNDNKFRIKLTGFQEVPSVSTVASGEFEATIGRNDQFIDFELSYRGLQGPVRQGHIHVAQKSVNGVIVIWLCQTTLNPAPASVSARVQTCPQEGTVSGRLTADDVIDPQPPGTAPTQQITAGELDEVIAAIRAGVAYVNVHTTPSPGGEIRGQFRHDRGHGGHGHH
jgi:hypothetical protein